MSAEPFHACLWNNSAHMRIGNGRGREWKGRGMERVVKLVCGSSGQFQIQTTSYVTRETATLGLGGEA